MFILASTGRFVESFITRSDLIQSNLQISMDDLTLSNADHRILLSCTKYVSVLFERKKSKKLRPQDGTYTGQVILSSLSVKFLGITFDSALNFQSHFHTVATLARHRLLKLNSIFSTTMAPLPLPSSASTNPSPVLCLITVRQLYA